MIVYEMGNEWNEKNGNSDIEQTKIPFCDSVSGYKGGALETSTPYTEIRKSQREIYIYIIYVYITFIHTYLSIDR